MSWCTIESDPGVFTSLIEDIGVRGVQVEELYSLEPAQFADLAPVLGLVFLFKYEAAHAPASAASDAASEADADASSDGDSDLFFARQVISNACATQAVLSILLNRPDVELGPTLADFKAFTSDFPPELKGLAISNSDTIRVTHNSFGRPEPFVVEERKATADDDVYHFIAYVPVHGRVYELDGLRDAPARLGAVPRAHEPESWLEVACPVIQRRIEQYAASEIRFNLLALIRNRIDACQAELAALTQSAAAEEDDTNERAQQLRRTIAAEEAKRRGWALENARRKHNYIPLIVQLLKTLAEKQQLAPLVQQQQQQAAAAAAVGGSQQQ
ncbi:hypothetical protein PybrP1_000202 [[Pythium] brassicae (nom. inval.)]|nr:hypothetical protein PybrP1_000202 [[Pythium] brassicae (nom. inval.)]